MCDEKREKEVLLESANGGTSPSLPTDVN